MMRYFFSRILGSTWTGSVVVGEVGTTGGELITLPLLTVGVG